jgi:formate dehydrogenase subunit gamma
MSSDAGRIKAGHVEVGQARRDTVIDNAVLPDGHVGEAIVRYTAGMRVNHWLVALAFICAALSGLALFDPSFFWLSTLFGGGPWTRVLHPFIGLFMVIMFIFLATLVGHGNRMTPSDWRWVAQWRDVVGNREERLPDVGRYNAGQKLIFALQILCLVCLLGSGIIIWRPYLAANFPIPLIRAAALVHAICAFVLILAIIVHIYAGIWVRGSVRAMTRGLVTPGWAWKHHRAWFREVTGASRPRSGTD